MENTTKRGRGRPRLEKDLLQDFLNGFVTKFNAIPTVTSTTWFDAKEPPQTDKDFIELIKKHTKHTKDMMSSLGLEKEQYTIINVNWDYDKTIENMYLRAEIFVFNEELRNKVANTKFIIG